MNHREGMYASDLRIRGVFYGRRLILRPYPASAALVIMLNLATQGLGATIPSLLVESLALRCTRRSRGLARLGGNAHGPNQLRQSLQSRRAIFVLATELLGLDDHDAVSIDATIVQREKTLLVNLRQAGAANVKAQMNRAGDFVDVLPARTLRSNGFELNFV